MVHSCLQFHVYMDLIISHQLVYSPKVKQDIAPLVERNFESSKQLALAHSYFYRSMVLATVEHTPWDELVTHTSDLDHNLGYLVEMENSFLELLSCKRTSVVILYTLEATHGTQINEELRNLIKVQLHDRTAHLNHRGSGQLEARYILVTDKHACHASP